MTHRAGDLPSPELVFAKSLLKPWQATAEDLLLQNASLIAVRVRMAKALERAGVFEGAF